MKPVNSKIYTNLKEAITEGSKVMRFLLFFFIPFASAAYAQTTLKNTYDYLKSDGHFNTYVRLIDDLNLKDVLSGSDNSYTLFASGDAAFTEFFKDNIWHVTSYDALSVAQKKLILDYSIINNAYSLSGLSNYYQGGILYQGSGFRRNTYLNELDSVPYLSGDQLPSNPYWDYYHTKGIHLLCDNTVPPLLFFTQQNIDRHGFTNDDLELMFGIKAWQYNDAYVCNSKVVQRDIPCSNGFINVLQSVILPPKNMAQYLFDNNVGDPGQTTKIFSGLLDRFSAPYYNYSYSDIYKQLFPGFEDSIFVKKYFATFGGEKVTPGLKTVTSLLLFDPGWNHFEPFSADYESDMGAIFAPSDQAMTDFLNSGIGSILKKTYGSLENIPDIIIQMLINRHMRISLNNSVPGQFGKMVDADNYRLPVEKSHITKTYMGCNGVVYVTNQVYPNKDFLSTYSPVLLAGNTQIMNWIIKYNSFTAKDGTLYSFYKLYLNSFQNKSNLFVPTDDSFNRYIDPVAYGQDVQGVLKFWYNPQTSAVNATLYRYNKTTDVIGDSVGVITDASFIINRLYDLLDQHIVAGRSDLNAGYYVTKSNDVIKVSGSGSALTVQGGRDIETNNKAGVSDGQLFNQANGNTCFLTKPIEPTLRSVYKVLSTTPQFSKFFELLKGVPDTCKSQIFAKQGVDYRVKFFNTYNYTVYVPTNEAIQAAIDNGTITPWSQIYALAPGQAQSVAINKMIRFLRYHFQDNAVFFGQPVNARYSTQTIKQNANASYWGTARNKYLKIGVEGSGSALVLTTEANKKVNVVTDGGLYNIIAKDYIFSNSSATQKLPSDFKNIDGTGNTAGTSFNGSRISTSSSAVIHQIDGVLIGE